jgi:hypothetical protein
MDFEVFTDDLIDKMEQHIARLPDKVEALTPKRHMAWRWRWAPPRRLSNDTANGACRQCWRTLKAPNFGGNRLAPTQESR